jgi:uncharacterized protein (DUF1499 family)
MHLLVLGLIVALLSGGLLLGAGPAYQAGLWDFRTGFEFMRIAAYGGLVAVVLGLFGLITQHSKRRAAVIIGILTLVIGGVTAFVPWSWQARARNSPPIHDITTDTDHPPRFVDVLPLREDAPNPAEYGGPEVAAEQRQAYPDIQPLTLAMPPDAAYDRALRVAEALGWEIVSTDRAAGRIEATATTSWFGFKDDIVIRVRRSELGARVDIRSVSRVGRGDVGTNARRVREFLSRLEERR